MFKRLYNVQNGNFAPCTAIRCANLMWGEPCTSDFRKKFEDYALQRIQIRGVSQLHFLPTLQNVKPLSESFFKHFICITAFMQLFNSTFY